MQVQREITLQMLIALSTNQRKEYQILKKQLSYMQIEFEILVDTLKPFLNERFFKDLGYYQWK